MNRPWAEKDDRWYARDSNAKNAIPAAHTGGVRAWLIEHADTCRSYFSKHPFLKNADYREMFDLGRDAAVRELRRLVKESYVRMEGKRRGSRYVAGPVLGKPEKRTE